MCKFFGGCEPDDPRIENMDPVKKLWMFHNWIEDQNDDVELVKNHAYLVASFSNPEAVRKAMGEGGQQYVSTDEDFDQSSRLVVEDLERQQVQEKGKKKRKRKLKE